MKLGNSVAATNSISASASAMAVELAGGPWRRPSALNPSAYPCWNFAPPRIPNLSPPRYPNVVAQNEEICESGLSPLDWFGPRVVPFCADAATRQSSKKSEIPRNANHTSYFNRTGNRMKPRREQRGILHA